MKKINDKDNDFSDIMIMALRYALGRRTYATNQVSEFIMQNKEHVNEKVCVVMLRDLEDYFKARGNMFIDDECDHQSWIELINFLMKLAKKKGYKFYE